jgi:hypothetical protein
MTNEERIDGLEDAVIRLSKVLEFKFGAYADHVDQRVVGEGGQIRRWAKSVEDHRASI